MSDDDKKEGSIDLFWDEVPAHRAPTTPTAQDWQLGEGDLAIGTSKDRILVVIKPDGTLVYGPEYRPEEAARIFWEAMAQRRLMAEDRLLIAQHMEAILVRLGVADMECERLRRQAAEESNPIRKRELEQYAELSNDRLNMIAHQAIELGRGLARRPEVAVPSVPEKMPTTLQADQTEYQGRQGMPEDAPDVCAECGAITPAGHLLCLDCESRRRFDN